MKYIADRFWSFVGRRPARQAVEDSHVAFTQARARAGALAPQQRGAAYGDWVTLAFQDFRSRGGDPDLEAFRVAVASATASIVDLYDASGSDPERQRPFVERCLDACQALDTGLIWYRADKLRAYIDVSVQFRLLSVLVDHLAHEPGRHGRDALALAQLIVDHAPTARPALLVLGDHLLAKGVLEEAATTAKRALGLCGSCPTAQALLYRVYRAQDEREIPVEHSDVALYDLKDYFCSKPFDTLTTNGSGHATLCDCAGWLPFYAGNALTADSIDAVWNSEVSAEIRRSILDGDFSYCSRMLCPAIVGRTLPKKSEVSDPAMRGYIERRTVQLIEGPRLVQLSHDATCNLACPSCRSEIIAATPAERSTYAAALDRFIFPLLRKVNGSVLITGWGDPFSSQHYRAILAGLNRAEYPTLQVIITTNGLLLTPRMWDRLPGLQEVIWGIQVSIDAASAETYENVRRPGRWSVLTRNLEFVANLRREGRIKFFAVNFVVQKANFREIPEFVELGLRLGVDGIQFQKMWNFGHMDHQGFLEEDVASPEHRLHAELLEVLSHPLLEHEKIMRTSNIQSLIVEARRPQV